MICYTGRTLISECLCMLHVYNMLMVPSVPPPLQAGERRELCASGREHLSSYAEQTLPLSAWLSGAEEKLLSLGAFPRSKERLFEKKEELEVRLNNGSVDYATVTCTCTCTCTCTVHVL